MLPSTSPATRLPFWVWCTLPLAIGAWLRWRGIAGPEAFVDEGANILTALDARVQVAFEPLAQGRPALSGLFKPAGWMPAHALEVARAMSAMAGLATAALLGLTGYQLAGRAAALLALGLWAVMPLAVFHERLALQDPFVAASLAGSVALLIAGTFHPKKSGDWGPYVAAGGLFGVAFLLKISAVLALPWIGLIYFAGQNKAGRTVLDRRLGFIAMGAIAPVLGLGTGLIRLGSKLDRYQALPSAGREGFFSSWLERLETWCGWYHGYGSWPLLVLAGSSLVIALLSRNRFALWVGLAWVGSIPLNSLVYHNTFARYALTDQIPVTIFIVAALAPALAAPLRYRAVIPILIALALGGWTATSWQIGTDPTRASLPASEVQQYFTGPWSGRGLDQVKKFLRTYGEQHDVSCLVLTHQFLRPGCYGLMLAELGDPRLGVIPITLYDAEQLPLARNILQRASARQRSANFILYEGSIYPAHPWLDAPASGVHRALEVPRGDGEKFTLYQIDP